MKIASFHALAMVVICATMAVAAKPGYAADHVVEISGFVYSPASLEAQSGDRVTWRNLDIVPHTATADDGDWDTGEIGPGEAITLVLPERFSTDYFCVYHPAMRSRL